MNELEELQKAIDICGGVGKLAQRIGVPKQNAISMWRGRKRVPPAWAKVIRLEVLAPAAAQQEQASVEAQNEPQD